MSPNDTRLIEVAFPLEQVSLDSVHEKNVRRGHISTLHIWPARRPLAACRAALVATLLPDPDDAAERKEIYRRLAGEVVETIKVETRGGRTVERRKRETRGGILHRGREGGADLWCPLSRRRRCATSPRTLPLGRGYLSESDCPSGPVQSKTCEIVCGTLVVARLVCGAGLPLSSVTTLSTTFGVPGDGNVRTIRIPVPVGHYPEGGRMIRVKRVSMVCVLWMLAWPGLAADAGEANRLMIEAVKLIQASEIEPSADGKYKLLKQAHDNLVEIVDRHPSSDLAVKLATGQRVGDVSLSGVREAMERVRVVAPARPGAPIRVWKHEAAVVAVASPSSGGRRVLTASRDGIAALRDIETGRLLGTWQHRSAMTAADMSRNGRRVLTGSRDGVVALREAETGRVLVEWQHRRAVEALALSRDGRQAVVGSGRTASVVNVGTVEVVHAWRHGSPATSVAYAPGGRWILAGFADGRAVLGDARSGREVHRWRHSGSGGGGVTSAAFSRDGRRILTGAANRTAMLRDVATGRTVHEWKVGARIRAVAYTRGGRWVLTGADDYEVELHDTQTGRTVRKWRYDSSPTAVAFASNDRGALMGFADGTVILCDIRVPERRRGYERTVLTADGGCW